MKLVKRDDALYGMLASEALKRGNRLPCSPEPLLDIPVELVVERHRNSRVPEAPSR